MCQLPLSLLLVRPCCCWSGLCGLLLLMVLLMVLLLMVWQTKTQLL